MEQNEHPEEKKRGLLELHESEPDKKADEKKKNIKKEIREWIVSLATALIVVFIIRTFLFTIIRVDGPSMSDTLLDGDRLYVDVLNMRLDGPDRFDVVILHYPNRSENFVKRVIGVPGDTIEVKEGALIINGVEYEEPYLTPERVTSFRRAANSFTVTLGDDEYFVMGDNRDNSNDSRRVGVINRGMFVGKVKRIIWPLSRWDFVEGAETYDE
ncbi:MAG: signal peptidase I [Clostridia bacterium]|nr:signal peptidase I [Clostridia bacterium]MBR4442742.1 signal peptidase I [Clostridia bacterium]